MHTCISITFLLYWCLPFRVKYFRHRKIQKSSHFHTSGFICHNGEVIGRCLDKEHCHPESWHFCQLWTEEPQSPFHICQIWQIFILHSCPLTNFHICPLTNFHICPLTKQSNFTESSPLASQSASMAGYSPSFSFTTSPSPSGWISVTEIKGASKMLMPRCSR